MLENSLIERCGCIFDYCIPYLYLFLNSRACAVLMQFCTLNYHTAYKAAKVLSLRSICMPQSLGLTS